jgi:hypothetical protein
VQLQEKLHVQEKEMQQQKLQHDKHLEQELDVVHQHLQEEDLLAERLQVLAERLQVLAERLQEELLEDLLHEEEDVNRLSLFFLF